MDFERLAVFAPAILVAITFHEFAHARVALALGDETALKQGRVTLNPLAHLDPVGTMAIVFTVMSGFGIGWGKPVPVNPAAFKHPRGEFFVSAAGPAMNFCLALLSGLLLRGTFDTLVGLGAVGLFFVKFLHGMVILNLALGFFNLIPLTPLDGSHALGNLLPPAQGRRFNAFNESYGMQVLFALLMLGWVTEFSPIFAVIGPPLRFSFRLIVGPHIAGV